MSDLISRSALIKHRRKVVEYDEAGFSMDYFAVPVEEIKNAPTVEAKPVEWIPCSERLPKEPDEQYIITNKYGEVDVATYDGLCYWDEYNPDEVIAWMPLPEPYKEDMRGGKNE